MNYDRKIHITTEQLANLMGVTASDLAGGVSKRGGPKSIGRAYVSGRQQGVYCRFEATAWVDEIRTAEMLARKPEKVPPAKPRPLHEHGFYRPSAQMRMNHERSGQFYTRGLRAVSA